MKTPKKKEKGYPPYQYYLLYLLVLARHSERSELPNAYRLLSVSRSGLGYLGFRKIDCRNALKTSREKQS